MKKNFLRPKKYKFVELGDRGLSQSHQFITLEYRYAKVVIHEYKSLFKKFKLK